MNLLPSKRSSEVTCVLHWKTLNFLFKVRASYMLIERSTDSWLVWFNALGLQILKCHYDYTGSVQWHLLNKIALRRNKSCFSHLLFSLIFFLMLGWNNRIFTKKPYTTAINHRIPEYPELEGTCNVPGAIGTLQDHPQPGKGHCCSSVLPGLSPGIHLSQSGWEGLCAQVMQPIQEEPPGISTPSNTDLRWGVPSSEEPFPCRSWGQYFWLPGPFLGW